MRLLAIGDVHGCLTAWDTLLAAVAPAPDDWIITLGDYIDRGPDSCSVVERLIELQSRGRLIAVLGNHEEMLLHARSDERVFEAWLGFGGRPTLESYAGAGRPPGLPGIPQAHWDFFERACVNWFETETHFFVHAGAIPQLALHEQPSQVLRWEKLVSTKPHRSRKTMVCGHTAQHTGQPCNLGHTVCIDTWAYGGGWLTCLEVGSGKIWQANQSGEMRTSQLADFGPEIVGAAD